MGHVGWRHLSSARQRCRVSSSCRCTTCRCLRACSSCSLCSRPGPATSGRRGSTFLWGARWGHQRSGRPGLETPRLRFRTAGFTSRSLQTSHPSYPPIQPVIYLSSIHPLHPSLPSSLLLLPRPLRLALGTALPVEGMQGEPGRDRRSQETAGPAARGEAGGRGAGGRIPSRGGPRGRHRPRGTQ